VALADLDADGLLDLTWERGSIETAISVYRQNAG
jgi:hypothetical protein